MARGQPQRATKAKRKARKAARRGGRQRLVWHFGPAGSDGSAAMRDRLGGKGANLAEMARLGLPVPPGFTIATSVCRRYHEAGGRLPDDVSRAIDRAVARLEKETGKRFGAPERPLLVSVRSGAAVSMPGMMDTVLNLGLNAEATDGLATQTGNRRFALDAQRRFIQMFGNVVERIPLEEFEDVLDAAQDRAGVSSDVELDADALADVVERYKQVFRRATKRAFPEDPRQQLARAISAVFGSWNGARALEYRKIHGIEDLIGTAVNVQAMVFGNLGRTSGTGVCFTRDPSTGENVFYGEYLLNAQGEDVVAGIRTPRALVDLKKDMPKAYRELERVRGLLERHYGDMQDIEFTIEEATLYILQTRTGKRTARASLRIAVDMARRRMITRDDAITRVRPEEIDRLLHPQFDPKAERDVLCKGLPASPGAVAGKVVFTAEEAKERAAAGEAVILVRNETSPEDIGGMHAAQGILTARGGMTSHAAVVARGMGKCCVAGAGAVRIDYRERRFRVDRREIRAGDVVSLDGSTGEVMAGAVTTIAAEPGDEFKTLLGWADKRRRLRVRANADTPGDAALARQFGAEGIGLCRTEHMFFGEDRITAMREMILAHDVKDRRKALKKLLPHQRKDFAGILRAMDGLPVTIRLLDPPLHEFLPHDAESVRSVAEALGKDEAEVRDRAARLHEMNPMLGHRGCRLGISYPEIYEMQVQAIFEAAGREKAKDRKPRPEVMIPLVCTLEEYVFLRDRLVKVARETLQRRGVRLPIVFGTMIEIPRAALRAAEIGSEADFFSFGTNDLTQLTFGFSRDDVGTFLPRYVEERILATDPFQSLDTAGVGELVRLATERGRGAKPRLKIGICGEHGGDADSIAFCHEADLDYVSCSPFRVPVARLASAHAALR